MLRTIDDEAKRSSSASPELYAQESKDAGHTTSVGLASPPRARQDMRVRLQCFAQARLSSQGTAEAGAPASRATVVAVDPDSRAVWRRERDRHRKVPLAERIRRSTVRRAERESRDRLRARACAASAVDEARYSTRSVTPPSSRSAASTPRCVSRAKRGALVQANDVARRAMTIWWRLWSQIDGKVCRQPARAQFDIEQVALDGRAHRKLEAQGGRDLAQAVAEHDLAQLGQGRRVSVSKRNRLSSSRSSNARPPS